MKEYTVVTMHSKELNRDVRLFIYLPNSYHKTNKLYPVLYMHDGHNLFDDAQATYGKSWGIIEAYERIPDLPELVIVGLETIGEARSDELVPFPFKDGKVTRGGKTDRYLEFLIHQVKSFIDERYRTKTNAEDTGIMGSSYGGVCSTYAALQYPKYFSRFGCVSNAYYPVLDEIKSLCQTVDVSHIKKMYMDVGTKESSNAKASKIYISNNQEVYDILNERIEANKLKFEIIQDAIHNEAAWEKRFPSIIKFLFNK